MATIIISTQSTSTKGNMNTKNQHNKSNLGRQFRSPYISICGLRFQMRDTATGYCYDFDRSCGELSTAKHMNMNMMDPCMLSMGIKKQIKNGCILFLCVVIEPNWWFSVMFVLFFYELHILYKQPLTSLTEVMPLSDCHNIFTKLHSISC